MADKIVKARIHLTDDRMQFTGAGEGIEGLKMDAIPPVGRGSGVTPTKLFLTSMAGCTGITVASLLRDRMRRQVDDMWVEMDGETREKHPKAFERITMHIVVVSPDLEEAELERAIDSAEHKICPVVAMVRGNVAVSVTHEIRRS